MIKTAIKIKQDMTAADTKSVSQQPFRDGISDRRNRMNYVTLQNGITMPQLGFGVYQTAPEATEKAVSEAL